MATLYGNDQAMQSLHSRHDEAEETGSPSYRAGAVVALVTWAQRGDPHWFGARIPDVPRSIEFVKVEEQATNYRRFAGPELSEEHIEPNEAAQRIKFLLTLPPAQLP